MVEGVSQLHTAQLQIVGIGYRCAKEGDQLVLNLGFADQKKIQIYPDLNVEVAEKGTLITVTGINKDHVRSWCGRVRKFRKPDVYKGKGVRWYGEKVRIIPGKSAR